MAEPWDKARRWLDEQSDTPPSWASDRRRLYDIIDAAERWGLTDAFSQLPKRSNLRAVVHTAGMAVWARDKARLERILKWASTLPYAELRVRLGTVKTEDIFVEALGDKGKEEYVVRLTPEQYRWISNMSRHKYVFVVGKSISERPSRR